MNKPNNRNVWAANQWLSNAYETLDDANHNLRGGKYNRACLHAHQTIELSFKAALRWHGYPQLIKTHILITLYEELIDVIPSITSSIGYLVPMLEDITQYYVDARYEKPHEEMLESFAHYDEGEARVAVDTAQTIYDVIRNLIPKHAP